MTGMDYILWVPLLPLAGFLLLSIIGKRFPGISSGAIATSLMFISFILSAVSCWEFFFSTPDVYPQENILSYEWLRFSENLVIEMGILRDPIAMMMILVVSFISFMVHLYSMMYMKGEPRYTIYFSYLGLFTFSMLGLVLASNLLQVYIFWELVGVSSFLLIGFYYQKPSAAAAAKKAFIVTRFADLGFLVGILILSFNGQTLDILELIARLTDQNSPEFIATSSASFSGVSALTWGLVLVFIGGAGKSAMFPLHIWLPDAMEGPTPVSALIHAATMVVAGVYLVARLFPIFFQSPAALDVVTWVGIISAVMAAVIACTQTDIKRVLAYSTMSQIGFMMFALGISGFDGENGLGYTSSMFHLFTHAFFKSLLFLCAGMIIHHVHSNEIFSMGGLRRVLPLTHLMFLVACLSIAGIPPFSGFFSKEGILFASYQNNKIVYGIALLTSGLTAFYMFRLYFRIFWNRPAKTGDRDEHNFSMVFPLLILGLCSFVAGFVPFSEFISPDLKPYSTPFHWEFALAPVLLGITGIAIAYLLYRRQNETSARIRGSIAGVYRIVERKFYVDEVYLFVTKKIIFPLIGKPAAWIDKKVVDGAMNGIAMATAWVSGLIKGVQSGRVQTYGLWFFAGACGLIILLIYLNQ